jgi:hypothetical protein
MWALSFALFPLGLGGFLLGTPDIITGYQSRHWTPVPAEILSSRLTPSYFIAPPQPEIRYQYTVAGRPYVSNKIWAGVTFVELPVLRRSSSQKLIETFAAGTKSTVYVDPKNPGHVALMPGPERAGGWMAVFAFFLLVGFKSRRGWERFEKRFLSAPSSDSDRST